MSAEDIRSESLHRNISRLCHFTPSRNLVHIISGREGVLATSSLESGERHVFNPTDLQRYDRHPEHIPCSLEYPNGWYLDSAKSRDVLFKDWVVLFINPSHIWADGTLFCPMNASYGGGRNISSGIEAFRSLFAQEVKGARGRTFVRSPQHLTCCSTDNQAEVLIRDQIAMEDILGIAVPDDIQARREASRFRLLSAIETPPLIVAPTLFDKHALSKAIRAGRRPPERLARLEAEE